MAISVNALNSSSPSPISSVQTMPPRSRSKILAVRVMNFVSKYFLEYFELFFTGVSQAIRYVAWAIKNQGHIISAGLFPQTLLINDKFRESIFYRKLENLDPLLKDPSTANKRIKDLNRILKLGTCFGQSAFLLKYQDQLEFLCPNEGSNEVLYLQSIDNQLRTLKGVVEIKKLLGEKGRSLEEFLNPSGEIDEALTFDFIRSELPKAPRFFIRTLVSCLDPASFKLSDFELSSQIEKLTSARNEALSRECDVELDEKYCSAEEGTREERHQKISEFFNQNKGEFIFVSGDHEVGIGHAMYIKNTDGNFNFRAYDPAAQMIYVYENSQKGVASLIKCMDALLPNSGDLSHTVCKIRKIASSSFAHTLAG